MKAKGRLCCLLIFAVFYSADALSASAHYKVGLGAKYMSYYEYDQQGGWYDREIGVIPRLGVSAQYFFQAQGMAVARWQFSRGKVEYDGELNTGGVYQTTTRLRENRLQLGMGWQNEQYKTRILWLLGYYQRKRHIQSSRANVLAVTEHYAWFDTGVEVWHQWSLPISTSLRVTWAVQPKLHFAAGMHDFTLALPSFPIVELAAGWDVWQRENNRLRLEAGWHYHAHRSSDSVQGFQEPAASLSTWQISMVWAF